MTIAVPLISGSFWGHFLSGENNHVCDAGGMHPNELVGRRIDAECAPTLELDVENQRRATDHDVVGVGIE
jgi:hypothetical protein